LWENSNSPDITISIDRFHNSDYLILYESKSIIPGIYSLVPSYKNNYKKVFTHDLSLCDGEKIIHIPPFIPSWIESHEQKIYEKTKLVSMIASKKNGCRGHIFRNTVADSFPYKEHLYGKDRKEIYSKTEGLKDYMFSICVENANYDTYYTEKIIDCFLTGTVPIYWGTKKISDIFDSRGILWLEEINIESLSEELYYYMLPYVQKNYEIARSLKLSPSHMIDYIIKNYYKIKA
jgi:hypothetical protein